MDTNKFFKELAIQDYITLGYLYLVVLGIVNIVIYYSSFDINIFDYIAITDILLAPINMLFLSYEYTLMVIIVIGIVSYLSKFVLLGINKLIEKISNNYNWSVKRIAFPPMIIFIILFTYIFLELSINMADAVSSKVKSKTFKLTTTITFADNTQKDVRVIATTSMYLFYVEKGEDVVTIMPISGNLKSMKDIKN
jgi:hypothetical protein